MNISESLRMARSSVLAHKLRSLLTMLGIIIGVGSIITIVAIGQMGEQQLKKSLTGGIRTLISIEYGPADARPDSGTGIGAGRSLAPPAIRPVDVERIRQLPHVRAFVEQHFGAVEIANGAVSADSVQVRATALEVFDAMDIELAAGRMISESDVAQAARVIVLDGKSAAKLFSSPQDALGHVVAFDGQPVRVIGVLRTESPLSLAISDSFVPLTAWDSLFPGSYSQASYAVMATDVEHISAASKNATDYLNATLVVDPEEAMFRAVSVEELESEISSITRIMTAIVGGIAAISLLVGGIGVMNIMLVSVAERTREIGVRKALGATRRQILVQFLIESMVLTSLGGLIGILLAYGLTFAVAAILGFEFVFSFWVTAIAVVFSSLIGVVFGLLPANQAAKLNPIEALRYE